MKRPFWDDGDEVCRTSWLEHKSIDEQIGTGPWATRVFRCRVCGTYWLETYKGIVPVSEAHALRVVRGEPEPPEEPLADFLVQSAHRDWPMGGGRVILPDMPLTEADGHNAVLRWFTVVMAAIADVLDAEPAAEHYVFRLLHETYNGPIHRDGYNLLVSGPLDWDRARQLLDPNLPGDWGRDGGTGPAEAIGVLSRSIPVRGPNEIVTVGSGVSGRRRLAERRREYEKWVADS